MQKLKLLKVKLFSESSASALETSLNDFFAALGPSRKEDTLVDIQYQTDGTNFTCLVVYVGDA